MLRRTGSRLGLAVLAALLGIAGPSAAEVRVSAGVDRNVVHLGERVVLTVIVEGSMNTRAEPQIPQVVESQFDVYSSGSSSNFSLSSGGFSSSVSYTYTLVARQEGKISIPRIPVRVGRDEYQTNPVEITVLAAGAQPPPPPAAGKSTVPAPAEASQDLFLVATVDNARPYEGEEIVLTLSFAYRVNLLDRPQFEPPQTTGFVTERLPDRPAREELIGGRRFTVQEIRYALFPVGGGEKTIGPARIVCSVPARRRSDPFSLFGSWFDGRTVNVESKPIAVSVRSLPETDEASFSGAVGSFEMDASIDADEIVQNEAITLTITISGVGNLGSAGEVRTPETSQFRIFDASSELEPQIIGDRLGGTRRIKRAFVPLRPGGMAVPEVRFTYFDPAAGRYRTLSQGPFPVMVKPAEAVAGAPMVVGKGEVRLLQEDVRYIHTDSPAFRRVGSGGRSWVWLVHVLPALILTGTAVWRRQQDRLASDHAYSRARRAMSRARKRLQDAREDAAELPAVLWGAVGGYIADRLNVSSAALTADEAQRLLQVAGCGPELAGRIKSLGERCDFARFAPASSSQERSALRLEAEELLEDLDRQAFGSRATGRRVWGGGR